MKADIAFEVEFVKLEYRKKSILIEETVFTHNITYFDVQHNNSKSYKLILIVHGNVDSDPRNRWINFGDVWDTGRTFAFYPKIKGKGVWS